MAPRLTFALLSTFLAAGAACECAAASAPPVEPRPGQLLSGSIHFPRKQAMTIATGRSDGSRLTVRMGFNGKCRGGGVGEVFAARVPTNRTVRVHSGRFAASLRGTVLSLGGVAARTGEFRWRLTGRFVKRDVATATVTGTAEVRVGGRVISRCKIDAPASVRLAVH